jgi:hypothetical protein
VDLANLQVAKSKIGCFAVTLCSDIGIAHRSSPELQKMMSL